MFSFINEVFSIFLKKNGVDRKTCLVCSLYTFILYLLDLLFIILFPEDDIDKEDVYKMATVLKDCGGLEVMLER